jgi:hypothetical protein
METGRIADEITQAVQPVGPQFTQVVGTVGTIEASVKSIEGEATSINTSVLSINTSVHSINGSVHQIDSSVNSINDQVASINASAHEIDDSFGGILGHVVSIDHKAEAINNQAATVIDAANGIKENLGTVADPLVPDIVQNSAAIAGSPVIDPAKLVGNPLLAGLQAPTLLDPSTAPLVVGPPVELPAAAEAAAPLDAGVVPDPAALLGPDVQPDTGAAPPRNERDGLLAPLAGLTGSRPR